jgi:hypothetical protein
MYFADPVLCSSYSEPTSGIRGTLSNPIVSCYHHETHKSIGMGSSRPMGSLVPGACARASATRRKSDWHHTSKPRLNPRPNPRPRHQRHQLRLVTLSSLGSTATYARPRDYGTHGDTVWIEQGPLTIIAVDPGHATLVYAVSYHPDGGHVEPLPIDASRRQKRRHHLIQQKLGSNDPK